MDYRKKPTLAGLHNDGKAVSQLITGAAKEESVGNLCVAIQICTDKMSMEQNEFH